MMIKVVVLWIITIGYFLFSAETYGATNVCGNDHTSINSLHAQGQIVVGRSQAFGGSCNGSSLRLTFDFPRSSGTTRMCYPSVAANVPEGLVIIGYSACSRASSIGSVAGYTLAYPRSSGSSICSNSPIPEGYVVTQTGAFKTCSSQGTTRSGMTIAVPNTTPGYLTTKCSTPFHDVPAGFVATSYSSLGPCRKSNGSLGSSSRITIPYPDRNTFVCSGSPVPPGFSYTTQVSNSACRSGNFGPGTGYTIGPVTGQTATICAANTSHLPVGYVVISQTASSICGSYNQWQVSRPVTSGVTACTLGGSPIVPSGYVITSRSRRSSCTASGTNSYRIQVPVGSSQFICQGSVIPTGWAVRSTGTSTSCAATGSGNSATIVPLSGDGPFYVCANTTLPSGFVITNIISSWSCSSDTWVVQKPNPTRGISTVHCGTHSQIPEGFVVTSQRQLSQCRSALGSSGLGFDITQPATTGETIVCPISVIPSGFVVVGTASAGISNCGNSAAYRIAVLSGPGPFEVCDINNLPQGYVVTSVRSGDRCGSHGGHVIQQPANTGETAICRYGLQGLAVTNAPIASGYAVVGITQTSSCPLSNVLFIRLPNPSSATAMCNGFDVPDGYVRADLLLNPPRCGAVGGYTILPLNASQAVVPTVFIGVEADVTTVPNTPVIECVVEGVNGGLINQASANPSGCH